MTATEPVRDQKAGWCSMCRGGSHAICASPTCVCRGKGHRNRPSVDRPKEPVVSVSPAQRITVAPSLVVRWEDPPEKPPNGRRVTFAPALLQQLEANPGRWARVDNFKSKSGAGSRAKVFAKGTFSPVAPPEWECASRAVPTGSAFYLRFVGPTT